MATENKREEKEPYKSAKKKIKINAVTKDKQLEKKLEKGSLRREKGALQHPKQNNTEQELGEKWPQKRAEIKWMRALNKPLLKKLSECIRAQQTSQKTTAK